MSESELGEYRPMVYRFLLFLLREPEDADEIAQETFQVAIAKGPDPDKGTNYGAWLRSIARNLARNHARRRRSVRPLLDDAILDLAERHFVESGADQEDLWRTRREALVSCMQKLSDDDRGLLQRRYERGERVKNIATDLRLAPNSLSKRLERIRENLRRCIEAAMERAPSD